MRQATPLAALAALTTLMHLAAACSDDPGAGVGQDSAADTLTMEAGPDLKIGEATLTDLPPGSPDLCQPGCHWDCFSTGTTCSAGKVWSYATGSRPCCKQGDPWPGPGPACTTDTPQRTCTSGTCQGLDSRYKHCLAGTKTYGPSAAHHDHLLAMHCGETTFHKAGDSCKVDGDCRPMAASVSGSLACDTVTGKCAVKTRPKAPADLGKSCGLVVGDFTKKPTEDLAWKGKSCAVCHAVWDSKSGCLAQGCTLSCKYDEDCPQGMVCVCLHGQVSSLSMGMAQVCAAATARDTVAGRTAGLKCHK